MLIKTIPNLILKIKRSSYPQLLGNLLFDHCDEFQHKIFLQFKRLFRG